MTVGPLQVPLRWVGRILSAPLRYGAGTAHLDKRLANIEHHVSAMTDILHLLVADASAHWTSDQRERVQRQIANFTLVSEGVQNLRPTGNPFTVDDIARLRAYTESARRGESFTVEQARDFRDLSERVARERPEEAWVSDLLKLALFIFGLYVLAEALKQRA